MHDVKQNLDLGVTYDVLTASHTFEPEVEKQMHWLLTSLLRRLSLSAQTITTLRRMHMLTAATLFMVVLGPVIAFVVSALCFQQRAYSFRKVTENAIKTNRNLTDYR